MSCDRPINVLAAIAAVLSLLAIHSPAAAASLNAPLVQCGAVTVPTPLSNCGSDPLIRGSAGIDNSGDLGIVVVGAGANQSYIAEFRSPDGMTSFSLGTISTDSKGNGQIRKAVEFALGKAGAGNIVLSRGGFDQYITGINVEPMNSTSPAGPDFRPGLVRCSDVTVPGALSNCGSDTLKGGGVEVEAEDGDLLIRVNGAAANQSYAAVLRPNTGTALSLGSFGTDSRGNGELEQTGTFAAGTVGAGTVVLTRGGSDQFLSGFKVTQKPRPQKLSASSLVRCIDVNEPVLSNCGTDPLNQGSAQVNQTGQLQVTLSGAQPNTSYEVFFRPIDNSGDVDTALALSTDQNGNAHKSIAFAKSGTTASGNFVVKGGGFDQFVTGFTIH